MKIYTKGGDKGQTSLFSGKRVPKNDDRIEAYGTLDEMNAFTGWLQSQLTLPALQQELHRIQWHVFSLCTWMAADNAPAEKLPPLKDEEITFLETRIDAMQNELPPMRHFILPGGSAAVSAAHICRTICRRAERLCVGISTKHELPPHIVQYLNRLSDYFFVLARYIAHKLGVIETIWKPDL